MSIVLITEHNENIYNVTKRVATRRDFGIAEGRYVSQHYNRLRNERLDPKKFQKHETMGIPHTTPPDPSNFLRKRTGKPPMRAPELMNPDYGHNECTKTQKSPPVPLRDETLVEQDKKLLFKKPHVIRRNIDIVLNMVPKSPRRMFTVSKDGVKKPLKAVEPYYIYQDQYGTLPSYLAKIIKEKDRRKQRMQIEMGRSQPICRYVTRDHREKVLGGLKANWNELQGQYQLLPILTDTIPKINRKAKLEADLKQLEKDIVLIERHPYIYVYYDDDLEH